MSRLIKRFVAAHDQARQGIADFAQTCDVGTEVLFQKPKRTLPQNDLMWVLLGTERWPCSAAEIISL